MKSDNKYLQEALNFIRVTDLASLSKGKHIINDGNVWVNIVEANLRPSSEALLEAHDEFIDIHVPISAPESYGIKPRIGCSVPKDEIDKNDDIIFFDDKITEIFTKQPGEMTIFEPNMAHAPLIGEGHIKKAIFKVRVK